MCDLRSHAKLACVGGIVNGLLDPLRNTCYAVDKLLCIAAHTYDEDIFVGPIALFMFHGEDFDARKRCTPGTRYGARTEASGRIIIFQGHC